MFLESIKRGCRIPFSILKEYVCERQISLEREHEKKLVLQNFSSIPLQPLSADEKAAVTRLWKPLLGNRRISFEELELFKTYRGFDARYLSHHIYLPLLARTINNYSYTKFFEHKSLLGRLSQSQIKFPRCFVRCIDGEYYDNEMRQLSKHSAISLCLKQSVLIVKDSVDSSGGKGVVKIVLSGLTDAEKELKLQEIFSQKVSDFVVQECVFQHPDTARFNPSSINTFRITTLYLNGRYSVLSIIFRFGKQGMSVDNWRGGILTGVNNDGQLHKKGFDIALNEYNSYNGIKFSDIIIKQIPSILEAIEYEHMTNFSLCKLIGWDVCINDRNEPVVIEINSSQPGVIGEQLCTGPIFGDRTSEVIEYCAHKMFLYNRSLLSY